MDLVKLRGIEPASRMSEGQSVNHSVKAPLFSVEAFCPCRAFLMVQSMDLYHLILPYTWTATRSQRPE